MIRGGLLAGVGLATAGTAAAAMTRTARAADLGSLAKFNNVNYALTSEQGWVQCQYCGVAFFPGSVSGGVATGGYCAYGQLGSGAINNTAHKGSTSGGTATSGSYAVPLTKDSAPSMQASWLHCTQCKGLFNGFGECPAHNPDIAPFVVQHVGGSSSRNYDMMFASGGGWSVVNEPLQARWNWCSNCHALYYSGAVRQSCSGANGQLSPHVASTNNSGVLNYYLFKTS